MSSIPILLAVFPLSKFEASFVARLIKSRKLVELPRASASFTASIFRRGGRRVPGILSLIAGVGAVMPPFSSPPLICATLESTGDVNGDRDLGSFVMAIWGFSRSISDEMGDEEDEELSSKIVRPLTFCFMTGFSFLEAPIPAATAPPAAPAATAARATIPPLFVSIFRGLWSPLFENGVSSELLIVVSAGLCLLPKLAFRTSPVFSS